MKHSIVIISIIFLIFGFIRIIDTASTKSATYDEAFYITYGYSILKTGDFRMAIDKTPLVPLISAIPLLRFSPVFNTGDLNWQMLASAKNSKEPWKFAPLRWNFSLNFLFNNKVDADTMLFAARLPFALLLMILSLFIFYLLYEIYGFEVAFIFIPFWIFCPNILANASISTEDFTASAFIFLSVLAFQYLLKNNSTGSSVFFGLILGLTLLTKYSAMIVLPLLAIIWLRKGGLKLKSPDPRCCVGAPPPFVKGGIPKYLLISFLITVLVIVSFYRFSQIGFYFKGFLNTLAYQTRGQATYCWGKYSNTGFWYYYLVVLLFKTPLPLLLSFIFFFVRGVNKDIKFISFTTIALFLLIASVNKIQLGLRYILPVYPFLFLIAAAGLKNIIFDAGIKPIFKIILPVFLCIWYIISSVRIHPDYLAYFNELAGGPENGPAFLVDSNIDWGQDLKTLKKYVEKNGISDIILSYYGAALPGYVGFKFQDLLSFGIWGEKNHLNSKKPVKEILAVSVTNLKGLYFGQAGHNLFKWLENKKPDAMLGYSIYVYDITNDSSAHRQIAQAYYLLGDEIKARRSISRAIAI
ncbi:MAG: glycosyltransferase family 39 protein, partial [Elusimicrobiota bacterium]